METTAMSMGRFELKVSEDDDEVAYLRLPTHSGETTRMSKSVRLVDLLGKYDGPEVVLDFDARGTLVGIEIVG
jgi:hypothetical protein